MRMPTRLPTPIITTPTVRGVPLPPPPPRCPTTGPFGRCHLDQGHTTRHAIVLDGDPYRWWGS